MNLRELWELCGNRCGNRKNPVISRAKRIYKREFPQFPHNIYILLYHPYLGTKYRVRGRGVKRYIYVFQNLWELWEPLPLKACGSKESAVPTNAKKHGNRRGNPAVFAGTLVHSEVILWAISNM